MHTLCLTASALPARLCDLLHGAAPCLLLYTGNEAPIEAFINATGFLPLLATHLGCALAYAEHRGYGASLLPPATSSPAAGRYAYLASMQATQDYAALIQALAPQLVRRQPTDAAGDVTGPTSQLALRVVAVGGSYGGMLVRCIPSYSGST